ncbi:MAG: hypothetical protein QM802_04915 [Agriterribacter sp.]
MISDEQIKEIRKRIDRGAPPGEVKEEMINNGYSEEDIAKVFAPHEYDMRSWYLIFAIILFFAGFWWFATRQSLLGFLLSGLLFFQYYKEIERLKKRKAAKSAKELAETNSHLTIDNPDKS